MLFGKAEKKTQRLLTHMCANILHKANMALLHMDGAS